ncbi:MAG: DegT/DnrJ/EryC1/StrS family aminotransferase [Prolixibacteraceae bacterium]|jgi:dTDP-4-amino-4,6-dideoxygalactose transaminase|nr:DegT/DnrJ/EryC1/StrS family aminotransferase [Prolixibacteraceae bacterium]
MKFTIGFEKEDLKKLHNYWDEIVLTNQWTEGKFTKMFEEKWSEYNQLPSVSFSSWTGAAMAALDFFDVKGKTILCPSNTFMATPLSAIKAGAKIELVDCNKNDLCMSFEDLKAKIELFNPFAVWVVHIGGHIAFEIEKIAAYCKSKGIILLEDCAHAHGASWGSKKPGMWGDAGVYSFYATKTISTGEGGMLVTGNKDLFDFAMKYRNYGKPDYSVTGLNYRINEFAAAIGCVQTDRLDEIVAWKRIYAEKYLDPIYPKRVMFPEGMTSGYYKYIVFEPIEKSTGKVYDLPCHSIMQKEGLFPNTEWVAKNHWCVPIYYKGDIEV